MSSSGLAIKGTCCWKFYVISPYPKCSRSTLTCYVSEECVSSEQKESLHVPGYRYTNRMFNNQTISIRHCLAQS